MNHVEFMEIYNPIDFSFQICFVWFMFLVKTIPNHLHLLCICALGGANKGLQVFILFNASVCIMWDVPTHPNLECLGLARIDSMLIWSKEVSLSCIFFRKGLEVIPFCLSLCANSFSHFLIIPPLHGICIT
jgi:hypothetical protein